MEAIGSIVEAVGAYMELALAVGDGGVAIAAAAVGAVEASFDVAPVVVMVGLPLIHALQGRADNNTSGGMDVLEDSDDGGYESIAFLSDMHQYQHPGHLLSPSPPINHIPTASWPNTIDASSTHSHVTTGTVLPFDDYIAYSLKYATVIESPYDTVDMTSLPYDIATPYTYDDTPRSDTICVTWNDIHLQASIGTSNIPKKFLVEQHEGVYKTRCKISIDSRGIVPKGAMCTSNTLSSSKTVEVIWTDTRLQARIGPYDIPQRFLAKLRDGVYRTTSKLFVTGRGTIPKGAICKLLYAQSAR